MSCCDHCGAARSQFDANVAFRDLKRYQRHGPDRTTRLILEELQAANLRGAELLDVGAGIGVLHHELLGNAVGRVTHVEAAPAYVTAAREEDARRGHGDRVDYLIGDAAGLGDALPSATAVTLDRVICCYPEWQALVRATANKSEWLYAFSVPRARWFVRAVAGLGNLLRRIRGHAFRTYVHPIDGIDGLLRTMGFRRRSVRLTVVWQVTLYARDVANGGSLPAVQAPA